MPRAEESPEKCLTSVVTLRRTVSTSIAQYAKDENTCTDNGDNQLVNGKLLLVVLKGTTIRATIARHTLCEKAIDNELGNVAFQRAFVGWRQILAILCT